MLILFDIDATLVTTSRAGMTAMTAAGRELFGQDVDPEAVEYAGRLDPLIIADLLAAHGQAPTTELAARYRDAYVRHLESTLSDRTLAAACPGVMDLLDALEPLEDITLGVLTGNFAESGRIKLGAAGIDVERFHVHVWGDDSPHEPPTRDHLPPVAMARAASMRGCEFDPETVTIIGDTPHDVRCALVNGCRALGVATGYFDRSRLEDAGAHRVADDLSDTEELVSWLTSPRP